MATVLIELIVILLLVLLNGVFALSELAVVSARKARLQEWVNDGNRRARTALDLADDPNRFLSTVQIGITLVGVLAGAFGGATLATFVTDQFEQIPVLNAYADALGLGTVVGMITYLSLVLGELVPKRIALQNPERVATFVAVPMNLLAVIAAPVVALLSASTNFVVRLLGIPPRSDPPVTEDEIRILLDQGAQAGVIRISEQDMVESVFELDDRLVNAVMTPHTEIIWLDVAETPDTIREKILASDHVRYPVADESLDNLLGIVHAEQLLARLLAGEALDLQAALHPPRFVPGNARVSTVLDLFKQSREHIVLVIDEHGGIAGLLTEHDLLEAIVGFIPTPRDHDTNRPRQREDGAWVLDGRTPIDEFKDLFDLPDDLPGEVHAGYTTLGGFIMSQIGDIPAAGECFVWNRLRITVRAMDGLRVAQVIVRPLSERPAAPDSASELDATPCP